MTRILVIEDEPGIALGLETDLRLEGYDVEVARDGETGLRRAREGAFELILLDVMMPRLSGFEVCKRLRANPATRDLAVLMVTALDQVSDVERALEAGTDDFLSKPIEKSVLLLRVRSMLRSRQYKRELDRALAYIEAVEKGSQ